MKPLTQKQAIVKKYENLGEEDVLNSGKTRVNSSPIFGKNAW